MSLPAFCLPPQSRPRVVGEAIVIGRNTVLARRVVRGGLWTLERPSTAALAGLLSIAYGQPVATDDRRLLRLERAIKSLQGRPHEAEAFLSELPAPADDIEPTLTKAIGLLKEGVPPARLAETLRRAHLKLPRTPAWSDALALCQDGVVVGEGTVIAPLVDLPGGATGLAIAGNEGRILALLAIARREPARTAVLAKLAAASQALARGDTGTAAVALCLIGQPRLEDQVLAKALAVAANELDLGADPYRLMKALGLLPVEAREDTLGKYNYNPAEARGYHARWTQVADASQTTEADEKPAATGTARTDTLDGKTPAQIDEETRRQLDDEPHPPLYETPEQIAERKKREDIRQQINDAKYPYHTLTLRDGSTVIGYNGKPMAVPDGVSLENNAKWGVTIKDDGALKVPEMATRFCPKYGSMDYQNQFSADKLINRRYVDVGNYNYGVVAAAAGYDLNHAYEYGARENNAPDRTGYYGGNKQSQAMIKQGFMDYARGKVLKLTPEEEVRFRNPHLYELPPMYDTRDRTMVDIMEDDMKLPY